MGTSTDLNRASRLLDGLENGGMHDDEGVFIAQELDPVLLHFIVHYLRQNYPASEPVATAVLDRVLELTQSYPQLIGACREGGQDVVSEWFEESHSVREYKGRGREMLSTIVDKLEG